MAGPYLAIVTITIGENPRQNKVLINITGILTANQTHTDNSFSPSKRSTVGEQQRFDDHRDRAGG